MRKILFMLAAILFVACGDLDLGLTHKQEFRNPYAVTPEEAVQLLQTVIGGETTRTISVSDIKTLNKSDFLPTTRGASDSEVIYIVDIEDGGSAILGADKRMEPIYAVLDKTKISAEDLLISHETRSGEGSEDIGDYILGLLNNAIVADMGDVSPAGIEMPRVPRDQYWTETNVIARQEPLLRTEWHQLYPFNNNYPIHINTNRKYPAGCATIALAQILYYNRFPSTITGLTFDWDLIEEYEAGNYFPSTSATTEVGNFVYKIVSEIDNVEFKEDRNGNPITEISTNDSRKFLQDIGYTNPTIVNYSTSTVIDMVSNKQLPVYARGTDASGNGGHAWVIDGCNVYRIEEWRRHYITELIYEDNIESYESFNIVHCNFGWGTGYNGEFTSAIFDPRAGDIQYNFSIDQKLITYSLNN